MLDPSTEELLNQAVTHQQAGRWSEAEAGYRRILAVDPSHAEAMHHFAKLAIQMNRLDVAQLLVDRAIAANPCEPGYHSTRAAVLLATRRDRLALASAERAIELSPDQPAAQLILGKVHIALGDPAAAIRALDKARSIKGDDAEIWYSLGIAYNMAGDITKSLEATREAIRLQPDHVEALNNLGCLLKESFDPREGVIFLRRAVELVPDSHILHNNLASGLLRAGDRNSAFEHVEKALELNPNFADGYANLGNCYLDAGDLDRAIPAYERCLSLKPDHLSAWNNLGGARHRRGETNLALDAYRQAAALCPDHASVHSNVLLTMHYQSGMTGEILLAEHRRFNARHARPFLESVEPHKNDPTPDRPLRIGFVSPDFRRGSIARFIEPLLVHRNPAAVRNVCFANVGAPDSVTNRLQSISDEWHFVAGMNDDQLAKLIRREGIDVLVDLTLHAANSRLRVFARKPAPVQVTYLAYCSTSGIDQMDYRITDPWLDPPGSDLSVYTEESMFLPETYWCSARPPSEVQPGPLPMDENGYVTFGCLNNFSKVSSEALRAWARILSHINGSRLLLHALAGSHRKRVLDLFAAAEVAASRIEFVDFLPTEVYFQTYNRIDIALDSFPFNGGTTTFDSLWMGVPVVTLSGAIPVARAGRSLLSNVGLQSLIAESIDEYVRIAIDLAHDRDRLRLLHSGLRDRMLESPLMNSVKFARDMEAIYRRMWHKWCQSRTAELSSASSHTGK